MTDWNDYKKRVYEADQKRNLFQNASHSLNGMTKDEFDSRMAAGLADAKAGKGISVDEAFDQLTRVLNVNG